MARKTAENNNANADITTWQQRKEIGAKLYHEGKLPLIEVHILRPTGPELFNRDFHGRHKTITVGGVTRARVSSQSRKHPIRLRMEEGQATRTRAIAKLFEEYFRDDPFGMDIVNYLISGKKTTKKDGQTNQIIAIDKFDVEDWVNVIHEAEKKFPEGSDDAVENAGEYAKAVLEADASTRRMPLSTALFGRMITDSYFGTTVYSATQMNHSYGINAYAGDTDDFTATDDFLESMGVQGVGAAIKTTQDISSNVYYEYTDIDTRTMFENLLIGRSADEADELLKAEREYILQYIQELIFSTPAGKQNSMASTSVPAVVYITTSTGLLNLTMDHGFQKPLYCDDEETTVDQGVERMKHLIDLRENGAFARPIPYSGRYWISDDYSAPDGVENITVKSLEKIFD